MRCGVITAASCSGLVCLHSLHAVLLQAKCALHTHCWRRQAPLSRYFQRRSLLWLQNCELPDAVKVFLAV